jgi:hypothetical protein
MAPPVLIGTAVLDEDVLVDSLVPDVIDGLRDELNPEFGIRSYRVYRIIRTWSGAEPGDGIPTDDAGELRPQPRVKVWDGFRFVEQPAGLQAAGRVQCTEVSLSYSEADLTGGALASNQELLIAIGDGNGQGSTLRFFTHYQPPYVDRERDLGWVVNLVSVQTPSAYPWDPS